MGGFLSQQKGSALEPVTQMWSQQNRRNRDDPRRALSILRIEWVANSIVLWKRRPQQIPWFNEEQDQEISMTRTLRIHGQSFGKELTQAWLCGRTSPCNRINSHRTQNLVYTATGAKANLLDGELVTDNGLRNK